MKQSLKFLVGLALIVAGVLWILHVLGILDFEFSTRGWWTLFIIVPCIFGLFNEHDKTGPCIGIGVGVLLLLTVRDVITWHMFWQIALALLIIGFGVRIILFRSGRHECKAQELKTVSRDGKDVRRIESAFGKQTVSFAGETVEGVDAQVSFGGLTLDLRGAVIAETAADSSRREYRWASSSRRPEMGARSAGMGGSFFLALPLRRTQISSLR